MAHQVARRWYGGSFGRFGRTLALGALIVSGTGWLTGTAAADEWVSGIRWKAPEVVAPGSENAPPADAIVLFDGKDLSQWNGGEKWVLENGYGICKGGISTKQAFGDCQLHVEWASPEKVEGEGQGRGNSGVYLMGKYELQVLDSYENETYFDGQAGAIYKQSPPLVNACRKPGEWQTYDIIFKAPRFDKEGKLLKPATMTVLHNGVLIQDHFNLLGETAWHKPPAYEAHAPKLPLSLQYHGNPVRFRNIWIRELSDAPRVEEQSQKTQADTHYGPAGSVLQGVGQSPSGMRSTPIPNLLKDPLLRGIGDRTSHR